MTFVSEENMRDVVVNEIFNELKHLFRNPALFRFEEVPYAAGVTDLVIANISDKYLKNRVDNLGLSKGIINNSFLQLYVLLRREKKLKVNKLKKNSGYTSTLKAIKWLDSYGYIDHSGETIKISKSFKKHITDTYAFELKISDWKQALKQAFGAKSYSNIQFVILDDDFIKSPLKNKNLFKKYNIGLISVRPESKFKIHYYPDKNKPYSEFGEWKFNEYSLHNLDNKNIRCDIKC